MNAPNINPEGLELPPGHRWVDIVNESVLTCRAARFHFTMDGRPPEWVEIPAGHEWRPGWSYCIPVAGPTAPTPEPGPTPTIHPGPIVGVTIILPGRDTIDHTTAADDGTPIVNLDGLGDLPLTGWPHWHIFAAEVAGRVLHVALTRTEELP